MPETKEGAQDVQTVPTKGAAASPEAKESKNSVLVQVAYPSGPFVVEGLPAVTPEGTPLSAADAKKVCEVAKANGVRVIVNGEFYTGEEK